MKKLFSLFHNAGKSPGFRAWLLLHLGVPFLLGLSIFIIGPVGINASLFDMLPRSSQSRAAAEADLILGERTGREAIILAAAPDFETAKEGAAALYGKFENSPDFENASLYFDSRAIAEFQDFLFDYRFAVAGKETLALLETGRAGEIAEDALARAYGAFAFFPLDNIEKDPFLLAERRMEEFLSSSLLAGGGLSLKDGVLAAAGDGEWHVLCRFTLAPRAVLLQGGKNAVGEIYAAAEAARKAAPGLDFYFSGAPFHSYESSSGAQREISIISSVTLLIILALFLFCFRSPLPIVLSMLAAGFSLALASAAALLVFREIHIITFVFGTTLIGTSVDYSAHFFVHWKGNPALKDGLQIRSAIFKSVAMSFASTEICFLIFLFAPFPILKQFAVFSMTGLLSSFLTALCVYPRLKTPEEGKRRFRLFTGKFFRMAKIPPLPRKLKAALAVVLTAVPLAFLAVHSSGLKIKNDISSLYTMSPFLLESEKRAAMILDYGSPGWYFIVSGSSPQETLEREEALARRLEEEVVRGNLRSFLGTSLFVPSIKTQQNAYEAMKALLPFAPAQFESLGFPPEYAEAFVEEFSRAERYCLPENAPSGAGVSNLWIGEKDGNYYSCVMPLHPGEEEVFRSIAAEFDFAHFMNKREDIGRDLDTLTRTMLIFFLAAYIAVCVLAFFAYPWRDSLKICGAPGFLIVAALAALAANGIPIGFFSVAALVLVFGLGLDYVFYMIGRSGAGGPGGSDGGKSALTLLAVALSFFTTLLSFGALALSDFAPVHIFGLTVSAGLGAAFIFAIFLQKKEP